MDELRTRVRESLDAYNAPELGGEIERRVQTRVPPRDVRNEFAGPHDSARRLTAAVTALVVFAAAGVFAWNAFRPGSAPPAHATAGPGTYVDPLGWRLDYPAGWRVTPFYQENVMSLVQGATFANVPVQPAPAAAATPDPGPLPDQSALPPDGVAVSVVYGEGGPPFAVTSDDTPLPLSAHDLKPSPQPDGGMWLNFQSDGVGYSIVVREGPSVSPATLRSVAAMIASFRTPSLKQGEERNHWMSLGRADRYPEGEGTPVHVPGPLSNVYVMRAPGGDYILDLQPDTCGVGEHETWDARQLQILIECPDGSELRYSRNGTAIDANPQAFQKRLNVHSVITSWDGMLLIDVDMSTRIVIDKYWPSP